MRTIIMKLTNLPEKWLNNAAKATDILRYFFYHILGMFTVITIGLVLSLVSATEHFKDNPESQLPLHELLPQAWDNAVDLTFEVALVYFVIAYANLAIKYLLKKKRAKEAEHPTDVECR